MRWLAALVAGVVSIIGGVVLRRSVYLDSQALADWGAGDLVPSAVFGWALIVGGVCAVTLAASHAMSASMRPKVDGPVPIDAADASVGDSKMPRARVVRRS